MDDAPGPNDEHPLLSYFGALCNPMEREETAQADFAVRIASIGRFMVREVLRFHRKMSPQGHVNFDPEDILLEVWLQLRVRNDKYDPAKANYRTFANRIMQNTFNEISMRARPVRLPEDAANLFRGENLNEWEKRRLRHIEAASRDAESLDFHCRGTRGSGAEDYSGDGEFESDRHEAVRDQNPCPIDELISLEDCATLRAQIAEIVGELSTIECLALSPILAGDDGPRTPLKEIAAEYGIEIGVLRSALVSAKAKIMRRHGHKQ